MMSPEFEAFQSGLEALKQQRYSEAVDLLKKFCHFCEISSKTSFKEYLQAQMGLVKAYHSIAEHEKARLVCQQLAANENPQVQAWVERVLKSLPAESSVAPQTIAKKVILTSEQSTELLSKGSKALKYKRYPEAVQALEQFCHGNDTTVKDYAQAQMCLVKAYKFNGQRENAIALCQQLIVSEQEVTQIWARQFILTLLPEGVMLPTATDPTTTTSEQAPVARKTMTMRTLEEFKSFCQHNLLSDLKALEAIRKQVLQSIIVVGIVLLIILGCLIKFFPTQYIILCFVYKVSPPYLVIFLFLLGFLGCLWGWVAFYTSATETYASGFKSKIIQKIFDFINSEQNLKYSSCSSDTDTEYTMSAFNHSQLFHSLLKPNKITENDSIFGEIGETYIFFSDICAEVEVHHIWAKYLLDFSQQMQSLSFLPRFITRRIFIFMLPVYVIGLLIKFMKGAPYVISRMIKGRKIDYQHFKEEVLNNEVTRKSVFKGLFFRANFNKKLKSKTVVVPCILDANINSLKIGKGQLIKLEDPEFSKLFTVYGNDQVEGRYILSTNLMAKLVKFRKKAGRNFYISFVENMIYIAIEYPEEIFEPKLFKNMLSLAPMREYFENIQLMLGIVEDLNLNKRIWRSN
jgi:tetratricopeptide (TPR) repeat protein